VAHSRNQLIVGAIAWTTSVLLVMVGVSSATTSRPQSVPRLVLGRGQSHNFAWESYAKTPKKLRASGKTCVWIVTAEIVGHILERTEPYECVKIGGHRGLFQEVSSRATGRKERTVLSMVFAPTAQRLVLRLAGKQPRSMALNQLKAPKATSLGMQPISYWAGAFYGPFCLEGYAVYDSTGQELTGESVHCSGKGTR
jgi:hypothetical protein